MWKRLLETTKQAVSSKQAIPAAAVASKPATPVATTSAAPSASKRGAPVAAPKLSTLKSPSDRRRAAAGPESAVTQASLLRLKQAAASKKTNLPSSLPLAHAHALDEDDPPDALTKALMSVLDAPDEAECATSMEAPVEDSEDDGEVATSNKILDFEWFQTQPSRDQLHWRREVAREKKKHYIFKNVQSRRYTKLMQMCANKLGTESTIDFFGKLGRETGVKEFNSMIKLCLEKAKACRDIDSAVEYIYRAFRLFETMKDKGLTIEKDIYGPFLLYLINVELFEEFEMFSAFFKEANPKSSRIAYYEMLLCIRLQDEEKIQELCHSVEDYNEEAHYGLAESYMLAFAESGRKGDLVALLDLLDLSKVSGSKYISNIFKSLGRLELENYAEKLLQGMRSKECADHNISSLILDYTANIPIIMVEDVLVAFHKWHEKFEVAPSIAAYDKIISTCCNSSKIRLALDVADHMCKSSSDVPIESFHPIIHACEQRYELHMARPIYDLIRHHNLKLKNETFRSMISLFVKLKDFEGAYNILTDAEESGEISTVSLYNAIMLGYYREKNYNGAQMVMSQMQIAGVKPDSETFSYLIANCESEENISKYRDQLRQDLIPMTRHIYVALIIAYARLGNFDMAKQVLLGKEIPHKFLSDIKSALVGALASNGQVLDALRLHDEIKESGGSLEPKAAILLIEHIQTEGELDRMQQLLDELNDSDSWFDGCSRVLLYCVQHNYPEYDCQCLCSCLSRASLDFLLSTCVKAKNLQRAQQIWSEYESAGLPHNVLTSLRMYQAFLSVEGRKAAKKLLKTIPKEDDHVRYIIDACNATYYSEDFKPSATVRKSSKKKS